MVARVYWMIARELLLCSGLLLGCCYSRMLLGCSWSCQGVAVWLLGCSK